VAVKEKLVRDVAVLEVSGKLMGGNETKEVHEHVKRLISDGIIKVVIDLSKVNWLNSQGIGMLIACYTSLRRNEGDLRIAGATEKVNSILLLIRVNTIFECFETVDQAVSSFSK